MFQTSRQTAALALAAFFLGLAAPAAASPTSAAQGKRAAHAGRLTMHKTKQGGLRLRCPVGNALEIGKDGSYRMFAHGDLKTPRYTGQIADPSGEIAGALERLSLSKGQRVRKATVESIVQPAVHAARTDMIQKAGGPPVVGNAFEHLLYTPVRLTAQNSTPTGRVDKAAVRQIVQRILKATGTQKAKLAHFLPLLKVNQLAVELGRDASTGARVIELTCPMGYQLAYYPDSKRYEVREPKVWKESIRPIDPATGAVKEIRAVRGFRKEFTTRSVAREGTLVIRSARLLGDISALADTLAAR